MFNWLSNPSNLPVWTVLVIGGILFVAGMGAGSLIREYVEFRRQMNTLLKRIEETNAKFKQTSNE